MVAFEDGVPEAYFAVGEAPGTGARRVAIATVLYYSSAPNNYYSKEDGAVMNRPVKDHEILSAVFAKMDVIALALAAGVLFSLALFLATAVLLLQSVPENYPVGPHLSALADYLPGYSVSWPGTLVGAFYGFFVGCVAGFVCTYMYS